MAFRVLQHIATCTSMASGDPNSGLYDKRGVLGVGFAALPGIIGLDRPNGLWPHTPTVVSSVNHFGVYVYHT